MTRLSTSCDVVVFCSSSGHCQLDCDYCIVHPVIKRTPPGTYEDPGCCLWSVTMCFFFFFSGMGDFFACFPNRDRFLDRLLDHDVVVALDINGVLLNEYPELAPEKLRKVRALNLTLHYKQVKDKRVEKVWIENAKKLIERHEGLFVLGTILSPLVRPLWEESLAFYEKSVFAETGKKIWLIADAEKAFSPEEEAHYRELETRFAHIVEKAHVQNFAAAFEGHDFVLCPAGSTYFRIWNDGRVQGCPYVGELMDSGNVKERRLSVREGHFRCGTAKFCDCYDIEMLGKMRYEKSLPVHGTAAEPVFTHEPGLSDRVAVLSS